MKTVITNLVAGLLVVPVAAHSALLAAGEAGEPADALVFLANLQRRWVELQLDPDDGWTVELTKNKHDLPVFPGEPVRSGLGAFQTAILRVESEQPITAEHVADRLRVTGGRWPWKLEIEPDPNPWAPVY